MAVELAGQDCTSERDSEENDSEVGVEVTLHSLQQQIWGPGSSSFRIPLDEWVLVFLS